MQFAADRLEAPTAIRIDLGAMEELEDLPLSL